MLIKLLKYFRDARFIWDIFGSVYNRRIYGAIAELYDHIAEEMETTSPARILDIGSGRGYISLLLAARNPQATIQGIDYSPMQVRAAEALRKQRKIDNCRFSRGDAMRIMFHDEAFDAVVSVGSIKHWPEGLRGLREMYRVLKPGGWVILSETDQEATDEILWRFVNRFSIWFIWDALLFWGLRHVVFGQSYTQQGLESLAHAAGFRNMIGQRVPMCPYTIVKGQKPTAG
jgi:ubiquinone/menaquinone biosynthesis C-methylase UbiE